MLQTGHCTSLDPEPVPGGSAGACHVQRDRTIKTLVDSVIHDSPCRPDQALRGLCYFSVALSMTSATTDAGTAIAVLVRGRTFLGATFQ